MKIQNKEKQSKDVFSELLPQAISVLKKTIIAPLFSDNLFHRYANEKPPLRSELFSMQQMENHAKNLAGKHILTRAEPSEKMLKRLGENESLLMEIYSLLTETVKSNIRIAPAGEWLLDNFYLIEEQVNTGKKHLPKGYSKGLPQLANGASKGLPRVYDIVVELISHSDGRVDTESLSGFINAYQSVTPLQLGELWAIPIMLRLALIENLRRLSTEIALDILHKNLADYWADQMLEILDKDPKNLVVVIADMARSKPPAEGAFVAELTRKLQGRGASLSLPLSWIEQFVSDMSLTGAELVHIENQKQAARQVSVSNSISSLRFLNSADWRNFVEAESIVEKILNEDPDAVYGKMDFYTRDHYRHVVEKTSKYSTLSEEEVAKIAIRLAQLSPENGRKRHVGYYLVDKGVSQVEKIAKVNMPFAQKLRNHLAAIPLFYYLLGITSLTFFFLSILAYHINESLQTWQYGVLLLICAIAVSQPAIALFNWITTLLTHPNPLPRMDFSSGIPQECSTLIVIPTLLTSTDAADSLVEALEVRYVANRDDHLHFALLTDFKDAATETLPEDEALLAYAKNKITALNERYGRAANDIFMLFHRPRKWNEKEGVWMGHERKRGKLKELNALLRGEQSENFSLVVADQTLFPGIKYIITLDTDTKLPREAAWKMTASLAHPLNKAVYCSGKKRVTEGYTILQPRVSNSLPGPRSSWYARIHGNEPGIDPYTRMTSDVYQDLFSEGSFIGKGIYEIDTFTASLSGRFPENRILSHDLVEGCYARSGFLSDVQLYEAYPPSYYADMQRRQRWIRGDWQILRWLFPLVPAPDKRYRRNPLSALSHWKIFDNIRRSLVAPSLLLLLLYGWLFSSGSFWSIAVTGIILIPSLIKLLWDLLNKPKDIGIYPHLVFMTQSAKDTLLRHLPELLFLPYEAFVNMHAIVRTAWRIFISKRNLLQWNPSGNSIRSAPKTLFDNYIAMWTAPVFATGILMYLFYTDALAAIIDLPLLISWMLSPGIAYLISMPRKPRRAALSRDQIVFLHKLSRRIWAFFEKFVTDEDNWLPPDNYQKQPGPKIAHRTSPTNIGLSLLANLTAYDFGYLSAGRLIDRTTRTFHTVQALEKYKGHLYNWYDTITLSCLQPRYISTVDSGNFIGHVITLKQGLLHLKESRIFSARILAGLLDTVAVLLEKDEKDIAVQELKKEIEAAQINPPQSLRQVMVIMEHLKSKYHIIVREYENGKKEAGNKTSEWVALLGVQLNDITGDLITLAPWLLLQPPSPAFNHIIDDMDYIPTLRQLSSIQTAFLPEVKSFYRLSNTPAENDWLDMLVSHIIQSSRRAKERIQNIEYLAEQCDDFSDVEYDFLYSKTQHLLAIGYNAEEHRRDNSYYDLLASEARLGNFVAIAQGKLPQESWFALGRQLTSFGSAPALLSWSGSMFEYLMPDLVMPSYENTLLDQTQKAVVQKQIDYGNKRDVPWGISESGYNMIDSAMNYQYKAFGVPGTGFKRGLGEELVISPYSAVMALMVMPEEACDNLQLMAKKGFTGTYGFYEAIDYTPSRLPRGQEHVIIQSFMIHHQGMSLLALSHLLLNQPMQKRFISDVQFQATLLLLQERIPRVTALTAPGIHIADAGVINKEDDAYMRIINTPQTANPEIQLLSNGRYHVMVSNAGGGYSRWKNIAVTRWREDSTCDNWGNFCFIRDLENNEYWSCAYQPALQNGDHYEAVFSQGRAEFRRRDFAIEAHTEIVVSPEDDVELRRLHLTNRSRKKKIIEVTSYAEVVLAPIGADAAHPAFSNLFVQTALLQESHAIICTRRARSQDEQPPSMFHLMKVHHAVVQSIAYETDRTKFTGRGNTIHQPLCMQQTRPLSFTEGSVLDPIVSIQYRIEIAPQQTAVIDMITGIAETKEGCMDMIGKYQDKFLVDRGFELSWTHSQIVLRQINATEADAQLYAKLASAVIYTDPAFRGAPDLISRNNRGQSSLWSHSISGDLPIVLVKIEDVNNIELVKQMIQAHAYWRLKGMIVDLVIWNEDHGSYRHTLQNQIMSLVVPLVGAQINEDPGGVFIRSADQLSNEDRILFQTVARVVLSDKFGSLEEQLNRNVKIKNVIPYFTPVKFYPSTPTAVTLPENLQFFNGTGGFSENGREYIILTEPGKVTPAPWCNVVANAGFGSIISESGQAYTWLENAHEFRITPWNNNPVSDLEGECYYLRDEESGKFWSPAPLPARSKTPYITRHGFGYSIFEHSEDGIYSEMTVFVDLDNAVKFTMLNIQNRSGRQRKLSVTGYVEWVLGEFRPKTQMHIVTTAEGDTGTLFARNDYNTEFAGRVAFFDAGRMLESYTCDRKEFLGRNGSSRNPAAMNKVRLSGKSGPALDPCAAIQITIDLAGGESHEIIFKLGAAKSHADALHITEQFKTHANVHQALDKVQHFWQRTLGTIQVYTPDTALNILTNGWLNYQTLASRIWGRSGYYQSGGAFGFRDQLQDILSLLYTRPDISRAQILLNASRQFKEGDVQHWWHPPSGRGVRTTCSDDYLWLPYVTAKYTAHTGDTEILEEVVGFIEGRPLNEGEASYYDLPSHTHQTASLYIHCKKAIERALHFGEHGLPLIGSGDWNDGMDKVGEKGKGESVWLAFFLYDTLNRFNAIAAKQGDTAFEQICREQAAALRKNIALHGWDGQWYRRAYFDDGTPLGSSQNEEASIDSIAQSWSVLSQAGDAQRTATAMQSASKYLVRKDAGLIQLLNPPFDSSSLNPGYIKGYVPGVRENGGQYTHAAIWFIMALMALKDKEQGWNLLQMINPVNRGSSAEAIATYKVEPYVIAADVYFEPSHLGQGGWTWYTGSAAWMYQLILESFLGIKQKGTQLYFDPSTPPAWTSFTVRYKYMDTLYNIHINTTGTGENQIIADGRICENNFLPLLNDGGEHTVEVVTGSLQVQRTG